MEEPIKVSHFEIQNSTQNKKLKVLVAVDETGQKWIVGGDHWHPTYLTQYEKAFDAQEAGKN